MWNFFFPLNLDVDLFNQNIAAHMLSLSIREIKRDNRHAREDYCLNTKVDSVLMHVRQAYRPGSDSFKFYLNH